MERRCGHSALRFNRDTQTLEPFDKYPIHLGEDGTEQFTVTTRVNDEQIGQQKIHDPFIRSTVRLRGFKWAWKALIRDIKVQVCVDGSAGASRAIMTLNPHELQAETELILDQRRSTREGHAAAFNQCNTVARTQ